MPSTYLHNHASNQKSPDGGVLIVDNYDSFTYNIRNQLGKLGADSRIVRNDAIEALDIRMINPGAIVIGPGPGSPHNPEEIGVTPAAIDFAIEHNRALLGICLGHQALAVHFGGRVVAAPEAVHGKTSRLNFVNENLLPCSNLLAGMRPDAQVMRYHSLCVDQCSFPEQLAVTSFTKDALSVIMSIQHRAHPLYGVQFHPESFATDDGLRILENFLRLTPGAFVSNTQRAYYFPDHKPKAQLPYGLIQRLAIAEQKPFESREFPCDLPPEEVYARLHCASDHSFCFESLSQDETAADSRSYFGFRPLFVLSANNNALLLDGERVCHATSSPFDVLSRAMDHLTKESSGDTPEGQHFSGGLVGFLSYEAAQYLETERFPGRTPDGRSTFAFGYFDDGLMYDRTKKKYTYFTRGRDRMQYFKAVIGMEPCCASRTVITPKHDGMSREEFMRRVNEIKENEIRTGNSFQTILSRRKIFSIDGSMAPLYAQLRTVCPSAHMHAIKMGDEESIGSLSELAMHIINGDVTALPLAGTAGRSGKPAEDEEAFQKLKNDPKERAEHMMLVDLERNDVARIAELGTVVTPEALLMHRKDAGPVMHIASEVRGRLRKDVPPLRALLTIAPMGTVSGAPKVRAMQIIYEYEDREPRGLYASSIGFIDVRGNMKAVMGLRSVMRHGSDLAVQAGAGIVMDSDPAAEYDETENKMKVPLKTLQPFLSS